jgi:hypothetical protein
MSRRRATDDINMQRDALKQAGCNKLIEETASGGKTQVLGRPTSNSHVRIQ